MVKAPTDPAFRISSVVPRPRRPWEATAMTADGRVNGRPPLRDRDVELLQHLAAGRSTAQISRAMGLSGNTVRTRIRRVEAKLDAGSRAGAVLAAEGRGVV